MEIQQSNRPHVIVFGNEKGGTGKSTLAMHLVVQLLYDGYRVGVIDTDGRQGTLSRYIENRKQHTQTTGKQIPLPQHFRVYRNKESQVGQEAEKEVFRKAFQELQDMDYIVIDTPGSDSPLSREAHSWADTLITPINDSFIDLDLLVKLEGALTMTSLKPSVYAEMVWDQRKAKAMKQTISIDWIVVRNRLGHLYTKNKEQIHQILQSLSKRIGFRLASGFGERVIFRELFLSGLTLLDLEGENTPFTLSHAAARQELRSLMSFVPKLQKETECAS
jgi:chromosome partitioning protein